MNKTKIQEIGFRITIVAMVALNFLTIMIISDFTHMFYITQVPSIFYILMLGVFDTIIVFACVLLLQNGGQNED